VDRYAFAFTLDRSTGAMTVEPWRRDLWVAWHDE
jgi:hypothetical protein